MIDLTPFLSNTQQKSIGRLRMSEMAAAEMYLILSGHGVPMEVATFAPVIASTVGSFLTSSYFEKNEWFRSQPVHRTSTLTIKHSMDQTQEPIFHLWKEASPGGGYTIVSCDEAPLSANYYEERVVEEVKVETGIL